MLDDMNAVRQAVLVLAALVEHQLRRALNAYFAGDAAVARLVIAADADVDLLEQRLDDACVAALGARPLAAEDTRFLVAAMKTGTALERIGGEAAGIARAALHARGSKGELGGLARHVRGMLADAAEALGRLDVLLAARVMADGRNAKAMAERTSRHLADGLLADTAKLEQALQDSEAVRALERIAAQTHGIARMVRYAAGEATASERTAA
jgi:phosphate transport system protein